MSNELAAHRVALRKAYLHAINDVGGVGTYDATDDAFLDTLDRRLQDIAARGRVSKQLEYRAPQPRGNGPHATRTEGPTT